MPGRDVCLTATYASALLVGTRQQATDAGSAGYEMASLHEEIRRTFAGVIRIHDHPRRLVLRRIRQVLRLFVVVGVVMLRNPEILRRTRRTLGTIGMKVTRFAGRSISRRSVVVHRTRWRPHHGRVRLGIIRHRILTTNDRRATLASDQPRNQSQNHHASNKSESHSVSLRPATPASTKNERPASRIADNINRFLHRQLRRNWLVETVIGRHTPRNAKIQKTRQSQPSPLISSILQHLPSPDRVRPIVPPAHQPEAQARPRGDESLACASGWCGVSEAPRCLRSKD